MTSHAPHDGWRWNRETDSCGRGSGTPLDRRGQVALIVLTVVTAVAALAVVAASARPPARSQLSYIQHFTAGVVIAVISAEVLPELERQLASPIVVLLAFLAGGVVMLWVDRLSGPRMSERAGWSSPFVVATGLDVLVDGITVGAGFSASERVGLLLSVSLGLEVVSVALAVGGVLRARGLENSRAALTALAIVCLLPFGAGVGYVALAGAPPIAVQAVLAFGAAALVYLISEELLTEAHRGPEPKAAALLVFAGFLSVLAITLFTERH